MDIIPKKLDKAMDKANPPVKNGDAGISVRNGPVDAMDVDSPQVNGVGSKRKGRNSTSNNISYKEASDEDDDDVPLVCMTTRSP